MTVARALLVRVGRECFALPLAEVQEVVDTPAVASLPLVSGGVVGQCEYRGRLLPVFDAGVLLGVARAGGPGAMVAVRAGGDPIALWVDDVLDMVSMDSSRRRGVPAGSPATGLLGGLLALDEGLAGLVDMDALRAVAHARLTAEAG